MKNIRRLAVDVGGTFIDFVTLDPTSGEVAIEKVRSSGELDRQFFEGTELLSLNSAELGMIVHGSTMVINTIVQENGARVGLITTTGFRDVLELGRGSREDIYDLFFKSPPPLVPRDLRYEVPERLDSEGNVVVALDEPAARKAVGALREKGVDSIAICFLHAYINPVHEQQMARIVRDESPEAMVSISSDIVREWREFERTNTTVLNAYTQPRMDRYLAALDRELTDRQYKGAFSVMQSSGGITSTAIARQAPIRTIQSGPAGGVIGALRLCQEIGVRDAVVADVGGTTFDVSLISDGRYLESSSTKFNRRPVLQPSIDIISIGAGGGSIAWIDREDGLQVGPQSAQADPGPACFGLGGNEPTVTDAQLVLGYLDPETFLGKRIRLDQAAAASAIDRKVGEPLGLSTVEAAAGIMQIAVTNMSYAVRQITVEKGHDPRLFSLICIGGGGGLFAGSLLNELEMKQAVVPQNAAVFSAWGLLNADYREDVVRSFVMPLAEVSAAELRGRFEVLEDEAKAWIASNTAGGHDLSVERFADMRYLGQEHTIRVPVRESDINGAGLGGLREQFDCHYERAYAHALPDHDLEFVVLRLVATGMIDRPPVSRIGQTGSPAEPMEPRSIYLADEKKTMDCDVFPRNELSPGKKISGPAIIEEWSTTILELPGQAAVVDVFGNLLITRES